MNTEEKKQTDEDNKEWFEKVFRVAEETAKDHPLNPALFLRVAGEEKITLVPIPFDPLSQQFEEAIFVSIAVSQPTELIMIAEADMFVGHPEDHDELMALRGGHEGGEEFTDLDELRKFAESHGRTVSHAIIGVYINPAEQKADKTLRYGIVRFNRDGESATTSDWEPLRWVSSRIAGSIGGMLWFKITMLMKTMYLSREAKSKPSDQQSTKETK